MATLATSMSLGAIKQKSADRVRHLLRFEGAALLLVAVGVFARAGTSWSLFAALFLAPDLSLLFYFLNPRMGAAAYNATHSTLAPLALAAAGVAFAQPLALSVAAIWLAHVGFDRALGYGLKYADGFAHTHLGWIGKARNSE
jgi:hypothetical protein